MKLREIEEMVARNGLTIVRIAQSKRIKVTVQRADGATETHAFPRNERDAHALKNREACLVRFARGAQ
jgi:hypothetical protein